MMVNDAELNTAPALDDLITLHAGNTAGADHGLLYRIEDGPLPRDGGWFIQLADETAHGAQDWAATIQSQDIDTITRPIESGVMNWKHEVDQDQDAEGADEEPEVEHGLTESGVVLLPRAAGHDQHHRDQGAGNDD
ncbi:DUF6211 family protein [Streptomyces sp. TRM76323]|uniref:DUF6211 family protein n=1 Tax=Streptomyces tamarix TaxID=3078565 RepID=A0ABU3QSS5_9ACTN|nr:DUF6211 family protein [Streptomyces tamarix]MDT9685573.1 DUF6211 family protein [Streptomyces tamarix]